MREKNIIKIVCSTLIVFTSFSLQADELHYNHMLIGDRASGLGGAYTAISDDAAGLYYNPAGIVFADELKLSASVSAINKSTIVYKNVAGDVDWVRKSSSFVPNFFGMTQKLGDGYFGFSYVVTNSDNENQDTVFSTPTLPFVSINFNNLDTTLKIGPSYAIKLTDTLNLGATLYFHSRDKETITNLWIRTAGGQYEWTDYYFQINESGINPVFGLMWSPTEIMSIGLSIRKTFIQSSSIKEKRSCSSDITCVNNLDPVISSNNNKRDLPLNVRLGIAYFPNNKFLMDFDISYNDSTSSPVGLLSAKETINYAFGLEYYYNSNWAFRGGLYTNKANTPTILSAIDAGVSDPLDHVDLNGYSLSITRFNKSSSITAGFTYSTGNGSAQILANSSDIQDLVYTNTSFYLSTAYQF